MFESFFYFMEDEEKANEVLLLNTEIFFVPQWIYLMICCIMLHSYSVSCTPTFLPKNPLTVKKDCCPKVMP